MSRKVVIDWPKAELVFGTLLKQLKRGEYPYNFARPPQEPKNMPEGLRWGSVEHACFLWCCCYYMRGGIKSNTAILSLGKMYSEHPKLFRPTEFAPSLFGPTQEEKQAMVLGCLRSHGLGYNSKQIARDWVFNFQKLSEFWKGDPAEFFRKAQDYDELCAIIMHKAKRTVHKPTGFYGFREKMVSMITHFLLDAGIVGKIPFPVPVDFHVLRIMLSHEILRVEGLEHSENHYLPEVQAAAREVSRTYCEKYRVNPLRLGDALWLFSGAMCVLHPGNKSSVSKKRVGRKTPIRKHAITWNKAQLDSFHRSCGRCKIAGSCKHCIPQAQYYVSGVLCKKGPREDPPALFPISLSAASPVRSTA